MRWEEADNAPRGKHYCSKPEKGRHQTIITVFFVLSGGYLAVKVDRCVVYAGNVDKFLAHDERGLSGRTTPTNSIDEDCL